MQLRRDLLSVKYWICLRSSYNISPILWECFCTHQKYNSPWLKHIQGILNHCGLTYVYDELSSLDPARILLVVRDRLDDQYLQKWRADLTISSKMRSYTIYKSALQMEKYLFLPLHLRAAITKFRLSCHSLEIETGRYVRPYLPPEERICHTCKVMEDEKHFLLNCQEPNLFLNMTLFLIFA